VHKTLAPMDIYLICI